MYVSVCVSYRTILWCIINFYTRLACLWTSAHVFQKFSTCGICLVHRIWCHLHVHALKDVRPYKTVQMMKVCIQVYVHVLPSTMPKWRPVIIHVHVDLHDWHELPNSYMYTSGYKLRSKIYTVVQIIHTRVAIPLYKFS